MHSLKIFSVLLPHDSISPTRKHALTIWRLCGFDGCFATVALPSNAQAIALHSRRWCDFRKHWSECVTTLFTHPTKRPESVYQPSSFRRKSPRKEELLNQASNQMVEKIRPAMMVTIKLWNLDNNAYSRSHSLSFGLNCLEFPDRCLTLNHRIRRYSSDAHWWCAHPPQTAPPWAFAITRSSHPHCVPQCSAPPTISKSAAIPTGIVHRRANSQKLHHIVVAKPVQV